jgi:hypothetical protein
MNPEIVKMFVEAVRQQQSEKLHRAQILDADGQTIAIGTGTLEEPHRATFCPIPQNIWGNFPHEKGHRLVLGKEQFGIEAVLESLKQGNISYFSISLASA